MEKKYKILFVCLGNICRSPAAEGILQKLLQKVKLSENIEVDSAGTYGGHAGELPDSRMRAHAACRGYKLTHRSRQIKWDDFEKFDLILGMDDTNISNLQRLAPDPESLGQKYGELPIFAENYHTIISPTPTIREATGLNSYWTFWKMLVTD